MQIYEYGSQDASIVLIEPIHVPEGMEDEAERIRKLAGMDFRLHRLFTVISLSETEQGKRWTGSWN